MAFLDFVQKNSTADLSHEKYRQEGNSANMLPRVLELNAYKIIQETYAGVTKYSNSSVTESDRLNSPTLSENRVCDCVCGPASHFSI